MALNDTAIKALKPKATRFAVTDRDGLLLEIHPSGKRVWRYRYRINGKREKLTLGPYPAVGLKEARKRRQEAEELLSKEISPALAKKRAKEKARLGAGEIRTVSDLANRWIQNILKPANKNARTDETYVRRDLLPRIGSMRPEDVSSNDIWLCANAVLKRGFGQAARRVRSVAKRIFDYAMSQGIVKGNPAATIRPTHIAPTKHRTRTLKDAEIKQWLGALYDSRLPKRQKLGLHLLLLVPARKGELINARPEHFDIEQATWDIPAASSKNGAPIRHRLSTQALELVTELLQLAEGCEWILPSSHGHGRQPICKTTFNSSLRTVEGMPLDTVIHDLRRTIRTGLSELGNVPDEVAELCLNHRPQGVKGVYDRSERIEERAKALQRWADHVDSACKDTRNVVPFKLRA